MSRRAFVGAAGVAIGAGLTGCTGSPVITGPRPSVTGSTATTTVPSGDDHRVASALLDLQRLAARYTATAQVHRSLRAPLRPLRRQLAEQATVLGGTLDARPLLRTPQVPSSGRALRALQDAERRAGAARRIDALAAVSGQLARLLAALAASHAQHVVVLTEALAHS